MTDVPILVCTQGALSGQEFDVPDGGLSVGRADDNTVVISDDGVSRYHARLLYDNGSLWLQDTGSRNGVFVNDSRVTGHQALKVGDNIRIAQHVFTVQWSDPDTEASEIRRPDGDAPATPRRRRWYWPF